MYGSLVNILELDSGQCNVQSVFWKLAQLSKCMHYWWNVDLE